MVADFSPGDADILVRAFRGENVERTPVWLMRQVQELTSKDGFKIPLNLTNAYAPPANLRICYPCYFMTRK